jgi:hypothetical protein
MAKILSPLGHLLQTRIFSGNSADHGIRDPNEKLKMRDVHNGMKLAMTFSRPKNLITAQEKIDECCIFYNFP